MLPSSNLLMVGNKYKVIAMAMSCYSRFCVDHISSFVIILPLRLSLNIPSTRLKLPTLIHHGWYQVV